MDETTASEPTPDPAGTAGDVEALILAHRKAPMAPQAVLMSNGRRGASSAAVDEVNRAGEAMAKTERDLLSAVAREGAQPR